VTPDRIVAFAQVHNFRDLGGYQTDDGHSTRWGQLFRSDAMHDLTESDLEVLRKLGIVTIVDLRNADEVRRVGRGLLANEPARFINAPVLAGAMMEERGGDVEFDDDYLATRYMQYLQGGGVAFVRALREMTVADNYPLIFNCFFGKDRTGVLAALVLGCLGVSREQIIADYAITASRVPFIVKKLSRDPAHKETIERTDARLLAADERTMTSFLDRLERDYGGALSWALSSGISSARLHVLSETLLE
jgi:protein-tyrosine phosphatase